jgi:catechol 2,3-dioxygenase-like lactoylglutathione lyase family enzyme
MAERPQPILTQLNLVVADMEATIWFYRRLGLVVDGSPDSFHVGVEMPGGLHLDFDTPEFAARWDTGGTGRPGGSTVIGFGVPSREAVDDLYRSLTHDGYRGHQPPYDAFWGARYAIVDDPDGNPIGVMSPIDQDRKFWPPSEPPLGEART